MHHVTRSRRALAATLVAGAAALAAGLGGSAATAASKCQLGRPISIYVQAPITGPNITGQAVKAAMTGLVAAQNRAGGILGCQVKATYGDSEGSLTADLPLLQKNMAQAKFDFVYLTGFAVPTTIPYLVQQQQLAFIVNGTPSITGAHTPYVFDLNPTNQQRAAVPGIYIGDATRYKRAAMIVDNTATGLVVGGAFTRAFENHGGKVIAVERAPTATVDWTPVISRVRNTAADVLFINIFTPGIGTLLKAIVASGWSIPIVTGPTTGSADVAPLGFSPSFLKRIPTTVPAISVQGNARGQALVRTIKAYGGTISLPLVLYAQPNDVFSTFRAAVTATRSLDKVKVKNWLERNGKTRIEGLAESTSTGFTSTRHIMQIKPGDFVMVPTGPLKDGQLKGPVLKAKD